MLGAEVGSGVSVGVGLGASVTVGFRVAVGALAVAVSDDLGVDVGEAVEAWPGVMVRAGVAVGGAVGAAVGSSTGGGDAGQIESGTRIGSTPSSRRIASTMSFLTAPMTVNGHGL